MMRPFGKTCNKFNKNFRDTVNGRTVNITDCPVIPNIYGFFPGKLQSAIPASALLSKKRSAILINGKSHFKKHMHTRLLYGNIIKLLLKNPIIRKIMNLLLFDYP